MEKDMELDKLIATSFGIACIMYMLESQSWRGLDEHQKVDEVGKWAERATENLLTSLEAYGYTIVKKEREPIPDAFQKM